MSAFFANLVFMNPWILAGLAILPGLYYLLRIMPPAPKFVVLPTASFLKDLIPQTQTPSHTPWWILLLRLIIAALVLVALAQPVYKPAGSLGGSGPVRLVIDNGWAGAQNWSKIIASAEDVLNQSARENRAVYILTTAPNAGDNKPTLQGPISSAEALSIVRGLKPQAWAADYKSAAEIIKAQKLSASTYWFGSGIDEGSVDILAQVLADQGPVVYSGPDKAALPATLAMPEAPSPNVQINLVFPAALPPDTSFTVQALAQDGRVLDSRDVTPNPSHIPLTVSFDIPESVRGDVGQFHISGRASAGSVFLLDERYHKRNVAIVSPPEETQSAPLTEAGYYLRRALEPYASVTSGQIEDVLKEKPSVIILPDIGVLPASILTDLESWVRKGGLLLRFAGPNMTHSEGDTYLVPTPLRKGGRALDGSMTWEQPQKLSPFPEKSPLYGLKFHDDITVRQQILAEPSQDLDTKTWASLADGTPLITAAPLDRGTLVFVHTTADPSWSDLALSGLYVDILRRIVALSGTNFDATKTTTGSLDPVLLLDGYGTTQSPSGTARAIEASQFGSTVASPTHPPGIYGNSAVRQALNIGDHISVLQAVRGFPPQVRQQIFGASHECNLMAPLLYAALLLLFADWFIMLLIAAGNRPFWRFAGLVLVCLLPHGAHAQSADDLQHANHLYLAYIMTGDPAIDATSQTGLQALADVLKQRTAVEPEGVTGVNPEHDELAFYPLIYWPITAAQTPISAEALSRVQFYLGHGGTILFDTRDEAYKSSAVNETANEAALKRIIGTLDIPPLIPAGKDHVLTKSFYLLKSFPGKYPNGTLWAEQQSANGRDGVSSILIGGNDWASAWAASSSDRLMLAGGSEQQEMALRFGVNLVIYALTGNYKADQVHVPFILERLGE